MQRYHDVLLHLFELGRLMRRTRMSIGDALGLLVDQLRYFEEQERWEEEKEYVDFPVWLYGQGV